MTRYDPGGPSLFHVKCDSSEILRPISTMILPPAHPALVPLQNSISHMRLSLISSALLAFAAFASPASAEHKTERMMAPAPDDFAPEVRSQLANEGWIISENDKPVMKIWLRKAIPGQSKPSGPKGNVLFPFLAEGELLGVVEVLAEIGDYRDQPIAPGLYTFRYGLQPINGDHLGTSPFRDYGCLVPSMIDRKPEALTKKSLEKQSAEAAGTSHPAIMMFLAVESDSAPGAIVRDDANDRTSIVIPLNIETEGSTAPFRIQWIVSGRAAA